MSARPCRIATVLLVLPLAGCAATTSTEVGVRTTLLGVLAKRGDQQVYAPGGVYAFLPLVNSWTTLSIAQQNLLMNANPKEGDRPVPDDVTFKTRDGNNVYIDVNLMWRVDPKRAGFLVSHVGQSVDEIKERLVRPVARTVIRDVFNHITSEQYYQVAVKNEMAGRAKDLLQAELAPWGIVVDMLQVQQHRFDPSYQQAINAQKQAEADVQTLLEQQKNMAVQKESELAGRRAQWNGDLEGAVGAAGRVRNEADAYYQTKSNSAKALLAVARAEAEGTRKEAEALGRLGGDAYVKMQVAKQLSTKRVTLVPGTNVSTMDVNQLVKYVLGRQAEGASGGTP